MEALHVNDRTAEELQVVADTETAVLDRLGVELAETNGVLSRSDLLRVFRDHLNDRRASRVLNNLASLALLRDDNENSTVDIFGALLEGARLAGEDTLADSLEERKPSLIRILDSECLYLSIKASRLFSSDALHAHEIKAICDARPIFEPNRDSFPALMLVTTLNIMTSDAAENERTVSIALRHSDIDRIIDECERAKGKLSEMAAAFEKIPNKTVFKYGENK